ncbi:MAG: lipid-A-disaccharide synthase [Gemmatimonadales bacterium]|jgi:lipid-A-disaccharide synthase
MSAPSPTVFVSAGEPSGDAHAAAFVAALRAAVPGVRVEGLGGPRLAEAGAELMARIEDLTVMGFVEVLAKVPAHARLLRAMRARFARGDIALVVLVDYPGFHLHVAEAARRAGIPVLYYIAPQMWAWAEYRVRKLRARVSHLAVILPFEEAFFRGHGVTTTFVGHPLLDRAPASSDRAAAARELGLDPARPVLSLFPGSRGQEVRRLWPVFRGAAELVRGARPEVQVVVAGTAAGAYPQAGATRVVADRADLVLAASHAALCKSGTTTLEAAIALTPMVIAYRVHPLSYALARVLAKLRWIGLVNLVAGREVAPEFIQGRARPDLLAGALLPLLTEGSPERTLQLTGLREVRQRLGEPGASGRAARIACSLLGL